MLRAFLGKCRYYRRFITNYTTLSSPLVQYTKQDQHEAIPDLHKDTKVVKAFRAMKEKLLSAPILAYYQFHGKPFILETDFSVVPGAIGGVLSQEQDGQERVIAYGARQLQPKERNYALTKGELLAVIFFLQYYKYYLLHRPYLDPVTGISHWHDPSLVGDFDQFRFLCAPQERYSPRERKLSLSGPHVALPTPQEEKILVSDEAAVVAALQAPPGFTIDEIQEHQERDDHLNNVRWWKTDPPTEAEKQMLSPDQKRLLALVPPLQQDATSGLWALQVQEDSVPSTRLYVPHLLRHRVIEAAHQFLGHSGINTTSHFCRQQVFMFCLAPEVHRAVQHCHPCQLKDQKAPKQKDTYRPSVQAGPLFKSGVWMSVDLYVSARRAISTCSH